MRNYYGIDFNKKREELHASEAAKPIITDVITIADAALEKSYNALKFSDYMLFSKTGNRKIYEKEYFERKNDLAYIAEAYWLTEDEKYLEPLENLIFHVCDEFSWCLPAHSLIYDPITAKDIIELVDLFQAETGRLLTDVYALLGDKLNYLVKQRIEYEVRRRVIEPLKVKEFHWMKPTCKTNWAAVCAGGSLTPLLTFGTDEEIEEVIPKLYSSIEHFLEGIGDDGCCMEGAAYWNYGFGYFVIFARFIFEYTSGKINYFELQKVKNIASSNCKSRIGKTAVAPFSDALPGFSFSPGLYSYLKSLYPDDVKLPPLELRNIKGNIHSMKELLWFDTEYKEEKDDLGDTYFENAQWFISRSEKYAFAAKAGHNKEPHNHNDVGSFAVVTSDESIPLADLGCAAYDAFTFVPEHRYKLVENASFGHSVPIINGKYQMFGAEYAAKNAKADKNAFSFDMEGAYEAGLVERLNRSFELFDDKIILCDRVQYSDKTESIVERFVTTISPEICGEYVKIGSLKILFDKETFTATVTTDSYKHHTTCENITVYLIDLTPKLKNLTEFKFEFYFE